MAELEQSMSSMELSEWMVFDRVNAAEQEAAHKHRKGG